MRASPYENEFDELVQAKIRAHNQFGWSNYSPVNLAGARIQVEPLKVQSIDLDIVSSTLTTLQLSWPELTTHEETGGSPILSYLLQQKVGEVWVNVKGEDGSYDTASSYLQTGLAPNSYYTFRVIAKNVHGWSLEPSDEFSFITAIVPDAPAAVITSLVNLRIRIEWIRPFDNYQDITAYKLVIGNTD